MAMVCFSLFTELPTVEAQVDDAFWFVAPEVTNSHGDDPVVLRFASFDEPAIITVTMPANPDNFPAQLLTLDGNEAISLDLTPWLELVENKPFDQVHNKGIRIESTANISAYYEVNPSCGCNPDIFALKGANAEGTEFLIPFQTFLNNTYSNSPSGFDIVATEGNTTVSITPTQPLQGGHPAGETFEINLPNPGSTYSARATGTSASAHAAGTMVTSNNPIAITIHDDSANGAPFGGCSDLMGDQLVPIGVIGQEYIAIKGYLNGADRVYFLATENNTEVIVSGETIAQINAGETFEYVLDEDAVFFETSEPVYVWHLTGFGCEVGGAVLPSVLCTGSPEVVFVRSTGEFIGMNILVPSGAEDDFLFNDDPNIITPGLFQDVPGSNGSWKFAQVTATDFVPQLEASRLKNTTDYFHLGIVHGGASSGTRYGYFSDYGAIRYQAIDSELNPCLGDDIVLEVSLIENGLYQWSGPNGFEATGPSIDLPNVDGSENGIYVVQGHVGECDIQNDTIWLEVHDYPEPPSVQAEEVICFGDSISVEAIGDGEIYQWTGPTGELIPGASGATLEMIADSDSLSGTYSVVIADYGCYSEPTTFQFEVILPESFDLIPPVSFDVCQSESFSYNPEQFEGLSIQWLLPDGSSFVSSGDEPIFVNSIDFSHEGHFTGTANISGCPMGSDSFYVDVLSMPATPVVIQTPEICEGSDIMLEASTSTASSTIHWEYPGGWPTATGTSLTLEDASMDWGGNFLVWAVSNDNCSSAVVTHELEIAPLPWNLVDDWELFVSSCPGDPVELTVLTYDVAYALSWTFFSEDGGNPIPLPGAGTTVTDIGQGLYEIDYSTGAPCNLTATGNLHFSYDPCSIFIPNVITPNNGDSRNDAFRIPGLFAYPNTTLQIYNRWGALMHTDGDFGTSSGWAPSIEDASEGTYFWILNIPNPQGHLTVEDISGTHFYGQKGMIQLTGSFELMR